MQVTGLAAMPAVHAVSALSSMLLLGVTAAFAWRARSPAFSLGISALMGAAPLQIHLAQRALIDGFFALWAMATLWCLWECLRQPGHRGWLLGYGASIVAMILTKENAAFVMMGAGVLLLSNRWLAFGKTTPQLWAVTVAAPLFAAVILWIAAGGLDVLIAAYRINVAKSCVSPYAIKTGDGPWYRYVVDLILLSPAVILLAVAGLGRLRFEDKPGLFFAVFFAITFAIMSQLHGGMNARYTNIWDLEFRYFALSVVVAMAALVPERLRRIALITAVGLLCLSEIWQYQVYFVEGGIYDPVPAMLMKRVDILK
jgi:4-amino-4-deoxy-L-arabinose transferase-like glycosyltransferase